MRRLSPSEFLVWLALIAGLLFILPLFSPHDSYIRFQKLSSESVNYLKIKWIYERIHFDKTQIDIAFIGTSHTQCGIDSERLQKQLSKHGELHSVVNFSVPHLGRDIQYLIARELIDNRKIKTLVMELQEIEPRAPHPGFQRLGTVLDIVRSPIFINTGLIENFSRLPLREFKLSLATYAPSVYGLNQQFEHKQYEGEHWNDTYQLHGYSTPRTGHLITADLIRRAEIIAADHQKQLKLQYGINKFLFGADILYRYNHLYLEKILQLAHKNSVEVMFLYMPAYDSHLQPQMLGGLQKKVGFVDTRSITRNPDLWLNADHLNYYGAIVLTDWLADQFDSRLISSRGGLNE